MPAVDGRRSGLETSARMRSPTHLVHCLEPCVQRHASLGWLCRKRRRRASTMRQSSNAERRHFKGAPNLSRLPRIVTNFMSVGATLFLKQLLANLGRKLRTRKWCWRAGSGREEVQGALHKYVPRIVTQPVHFTRFFPSIAAQIRARADDEISDGLGRQCIPFTPWPCTTSARLYSRMRQPQIDERAVRGASRRRWRR